MPRLGWTYRLTAPILDDDPAVEGAPSLTATKKAVKAKGEALAKAVRASAWYKEKGPQNEDDYLNELEQLCDEVSDAEDLDHFNLCLNALYDQGDADRCLIDLRVKS